ncbi:YeeE/YedE family protein [Grimontia marina]|uniref:Uncharacterized protein n=1 Tax=Grimontia marina TaxID=646534 RepID=A0A128F2D3_9GAMM|nr:YeeE/YedE thiosulfate transporter family protein [Grimontia marina]CZF80705.1 hypothetical protein GMA8713_01562 [Grimontia marina]
MTFQIPWDALLGGVLLGLSGLILLALNGRIAGISSIMGGVIKPKKLGISWQLLFLGGMIAAGLIAPVSGFDYPDFSSVSEETSPLFIISAGLFVGVGTTLANGCTSGHGICGIGRLSRRSIVATLTFMAAASVTVFARLHL